MRPPFVSSILVVFRVSEFMMSRFGARYKHAQESLRSSIVVFAAEKLIGGRDFPTTPEQIKNLDPGAKLG